jgi:putative membrane-bound dehydrogenase-like protein
LVLASYVLLGVACCPAGEQPSTPTPQRPTIPGTNRLASFEVKPGFRIDVLTAEPAVVAPVAMAFDENGRLFVAEMRDYPDQRNASPHLGRIRLLEDTDGDGSFSSSTVFATDLAWPSALACSGGGLFVAATPEIVYLKDTRRTGNADLRQVLFTGLGSAAEPADPQRLVNNLAWGVDCRIHGGNAGVGALVTRVGEPAGEPVLLGTHDFAFDPRSLLLGVDGGSAQSGLSFDQRGGKFTSSLGRPLAAVVWEPRYFNRNPFFVPPPDQIEVLSAGTRLFPLPLATQPPPTAASSSATNSPARDLSRAQKQTPAGPTGLSQGRGCLIYRGSSFPTNYLGNAFIADPAAHLIHRAVLREGAWGPTAERAGDERASEFLRSSDPDFQPVQIISGPDGALYIADLHGGGERGRILRVAPKELKPAKLPRLADAKTEDLVRALAHPNGWHRDTAQRLLLERLDQSAVGLLTNMLSNSRLALVRLTALRTVAAMGGLSEAVLVRALRDTDPTVREHALQLVEWIAPRGSVSDEIWGLLSTLVEDPAPRVRYQLALTLGQIHRPDRNQLLARVLGRDLDNVWTQGAVLSSLAEGAGQMFVLLAGTPATQATPAGRDFLRRASGVVGTQGQMGEVSRALDFIDRSGMNPSATIALLASIGEGLHRTRSSLELVDGQHRLARFYTLALDRATDRSQSVADRIDALRLLGVSPFTFTDVGDVLLLLLGPGESFAIQSAVISTLGQVNDLRVVSGVLARWSALSPALRDRAITAFLSRVDFIPPVVAALESGALPVTDLSSIQLNFLRTFRDPAMRRRVVALFGPVTGQRTKVVEQHRAAQGLKGNGPHGRELYLARCASCHEPVAGVPAWAPGLAAARLKGKSSLLTDLLEPNRDSARVYATTVADTQSRENLIGLVRDQNATSVIFQEFNGRTQVLPRSNLRFLQAQSWSLMPEGLEQGLSLQDMADLLEYLVANP